MKYFSFSKSEVRIQEPEVRRWGTVPQSFENGYIFALDTKDKQGFKKKPCAFKLEMKGQASSNSPKKDEVSLRSLVLFFLDSSVLS